MSLRIVVKDDKGAAKLQLMFGNEVIGIAHMSWPSYLASVKSLLSVVMKVAQTVIAKEMADLLWRDAQSMVANADAEAAKDKLLSFGWSQDKIDQFAKELGSKLAQQLASHLPEHR